MHLREGGIKWKLGDAKQWKPPFFAFSRLKAATSFHTPQQVRCHCAFSDPHAKGLLILSRGNPRFRVDVDQNPLAVLPAIAATAKRVQIS